MLDFHAHSLRFIAVNFTCILMKWEIRFHYKSDNRKGWNRK